MERAYKSRNESSRAARTASDQQRLSWTLAELLLARRYAEDACRSRWDFAVEIDLLRSMGANQNDFRFLSCMKYVEHAVEVTRSVEDGRRFRPCGELVFEDPHAFVLTDTGVEFARRLLADNPFLHERTTVGFGATDTATQPDALNSNTGSESAVLEIVSAAASVQLTPTWDADRHEFRLGKALVKQFKWPAANQEVILAAFHEEDWTARIDDPLSPQPEQDSKRRLHDTIKCLNRKQVNNLIRFRGDGTGEGVIWELIEQRADTARPTTTPVGVEPQKGAFCS
jgi:hypothetical protein